jgi:hypothetical protein
MAASTAEISEYQRRIDQMEARQTKKRLLKQLEELEKAEREEEEEHKAEDKPEPPAQAAAQAAPPAAPPAAASMLDPGVGNNRFAALAEVSLECHISTQAEQHEEILHVELGEVDSKKSYVSLRELTKHLQVIGAFGEDMGILPTRSNPAGADCHAQVKVSATDPAGRTVEYRVTAKAGMANSKRADSLQAHKLVFRPEIGEVHEKTPDWLRVVLGERDTSPSPAKKPRGDQVRGPEPTRPDCANRKHSSSPSSPETCSMPRRQRSRKTSWSAWWQNWNRSPEWNPQKTWMRSEWRSSPPWAGPQCLSRMKTWPGSKPSDIRRTGQCGSCTTKRCRTEKSKPQSEQASKRGIWGGASGSGTSRHPQHRRQVLEIIKSTVKETVVLVRITWGRKDKPNIGNDPE